MVCHKDTWVVIPWDVQEFWVHGPTRAFFYEGRFFMNLHKMPLLQILLYSVDGLS